MTLFTAFGQFAGQAAVAAAAPGMVLLTPSSISHTGTSATLGANGQISFTTVTVLSVNGVFSSDFDNYAISMWSTSPDPSISISFRLRVSGSDNATASSYLTQFISANNSTVSGTRLTTDKGYIAAGSGTAYNGAYATLFAPFLAQPTLWLTKQVWGRDSARLEDYSGKHTQSTTYDGLSIFPGGSGATGALQIYGLRS